MHWVYNWFGRALIGFLLFSSLIKWVFGVFFLKNIILSEAEVSGSWCRAEGKGQSMVRR
jgi:hypothetical protein